MIKKIIALANNLDELGHIKVANELDEVLKEVLEENLCEVYVQSIGDPTWTLFSKMPLVEMDKMRIANEIGPNKLIKIKMPPGMKGHRYNFYKTTLENGKTNLYTIQSPNVLNTPR